MKVTELGEDRIRDIGHAFGYYDYGEETGLTYAFSGKETTADYICAYVRGMLRSASLRQLLRFGMAVRRGGVSLQSRMDREKKPYLFVGMVCVREAYQGQAYTRQVMDIAFAEGDRLGVPVILETDARSKCDKYVHLGMELAGIRDLGAFGKLYDLIRYPGGAPAGQ